MALRIAIFACLAAAVCAQVPLGIYPSPAVPAALPIRAVNPYANYALEDQYGPAQYQFQYEINDPETADIKSQEETRNGEAVQGRYSLVQPDGLRRIVEYGDNGAGFVASVRYEPSGIQIPQPPQYRYPGLIGAGGLPQPIVARIG